MADYRAIFVTCEAIIRLLRSSAQQENFNNELEFRVYMAKDFAQPMNSGVSLFLYRILPNGSHRIPAGRSGPGGRRFRSQLPLDLHFILTVWGQNASLQHTLAGWMMRVMEDTPILPSGLLDVVAGGVFQAAETVEVSLAELTNEDMLRLWDVLVPTDIYQLSVPYVARNIWIESSRSEQDGPPVQERNFDLGLIEAQ